MTHDPVNHPSHYTSRPVECIEVTRRLPFALGNAVKYLWRAGEKGDPFTDLAKAQWYLADHRLNPQPCPDVRPLLTLAYRAFPAEADRLRRDAIEAVLRCGEDGARDEYGSDAIAALAASFPRNPKA